MWQTDKASMLDEAIEYLKQLQLQVQVCSFLLCILVYSELQNTLHGKILIKFHTVWSYPKISSKTFVAGCIIKSNQEREIGKQLQCDLHGWTM